LGASPVTSTLVRSAVLLSKDVQQGAHGDGHWPMKTLTVNADDHPLMKRFHKPNDEKRSVVIVPPTQYEE